MDPSASPPQRHTLCLPAADPHALAQGAALLGAGRLVALPTETVYGLAADATNGEAVARPAGLDVAPAEQPAEAGA